MLICIISQKLDGVLALDRINYRLDRPLFESDAISQQVLLRDQGLLGAGKARGQQ